MEEPREPLATIRLAVEVSSVSARTWRDSRSLSSHVEVELLIVVIVSAGEGVGK